MCFHGLRTHSFFLQFIYYSLFMHSPAEKYFGCSQVLAVMNKGTIKLYVGLIWFLLLSISFFVWARHIYVICIWNQSFCMLVCLLFSILSWNLSPNQLHISVVCSFHSLVIFHYMKIWNTYKLLTSSAVDEYFVYFHSGDILHNNAVNIVYRSFVGYIFI